MLLPSRGCARFHFQPYRRDGAARLDWLVISASAVGKLMRAKADHATVVDAQRRRSPALAASWSSAQSRRRWQGEQRPLRAAEIMATRMLNLHADNCRVVEMSINKIRRRCLA